MAPDEILDGIVLELTADWVLLARLRDGGYFNGYSIVRLADFRRVESRTTFLPFLREHQPWPPAKPAEPIDLGGPAAFITDAVRLAGVVSLFVEVRRPDECWIGSPVHWGKKTVWIQTIEPDATWEEMMIPFKFKHLRRIDFLDDYNKALVILAGPEPEPAADGQPG